MVNSENRELSKLLKEREEVKRLKDILHCDDVLIYMSDKTKTDGSGDKFPLAEEWWRQTYKKRDNGITVITGYWNKKTGKHISKELYSKLKIEEQVGFIAVSPREYKINDNVLLCFDGNQIQLKLYELKDNFDSRYRTSLEILVKACNDNIIKYSPKKENVSDKNIYEAIRNKFKRWFRLYKYEYNLIISDGELGFIVYEELKRQMENKEYINKNAVAFKNTLYLKGFGQGKQSDDIVIKYYSITAKQERRDFIKKDDDFKLEVTFKKDYFKKNKYKIQQFTSQDKIFKIISSDVIAYFKKYVYNPLKLKKEVIAMLKQKLLVSNEETLFNNLFQVDRVNSRINKRLEKIDNEIIKIQQRLEEQDRINKEQDRINKEQDRINKEQDRKNKEIEEAIKLFLDKK